MTRRQPKSNVQPSPTPATVAAGWLPPATCALTTALLTTRLCESPESSVLGQTLWLTFMSFGLLLLVLWGWFRETLPRPRREMLDLCVGLLCGGHCLSAVLVLLGEGNQRAALNMFLEWGGIAALWSVLRSLSLIPEARSILIRGLLAMLIVQAGLGIRQHHYGYSEMSKGYLSMRQELDRLEAVPVRSPDLQQQIQRLQQKMIQAGVRPHMLDGPGRQAFEARLLQSSEALGRCSLANTLAGLLLLGWPFLTGSLLQSIIAFFSRTTRSPSGLSVTLKLIVWSVLSYGLLLTKSRTAYVGLLVSTMLLTGITVFQVVLSRGGRIAVVLGISLAITAAMIGGYLTGGIDRLVWEEIPKSMKYRTEYWRGAAGVISEASVFGVGPGQFRQHYLRHKLPESSEEIVDPHNMFLDAWSNGGLPALAGLVGIIFCVIASLVLRPSVTPLTNDDSNDGSDRIPKTPEVTSIDPVWNQLAWISGLIGFLWLYLAGAGGESELLFLGGIWVVLMLLGNVWFGTPRDTRFQEWGLFGLIGLGVHLLGNGGLGMPTALICGLAVLANSIPPRRSLVAPAPRSLAIFGAASLGWGVACLVWGVLPVSRAADRSEASAYARSPEARLNDLKLAAEADPLSPDGWGDLSVAATEVWLQQPLRSDPIYKLGVSAAQEAIRRDPLNGVRYRQLASLYWYRARIEKSSETAKLAAATFEQAVRRAPQRADLLADAAEAASLAGDSVRSRELAVRALALDDLNHQAGHSDKYLMKDQQARLQSLVGKEISPKP